MCGKILFVKIVFVWLSEIVYLYLCGYLESFAFICVAVWNHLPLFVWLSGNHLLLLVWLSGLWNVESFAFICEAVWKSFGELLDLRNRN